MASPSLAARVLTRTAARRTYRPRRYADTPVPTARELHVLNRLGCGFSASSFQQLRRAGGAVEWVEEQLDPAALRESPLVEALPSWFPRLGESPRQKYDTDRSPGGYQNWEYARDLCNSTILRRIYSTRTLLESMTELWSNHLHVESRHFPGFTNRVGYDDTIRAHALGTFSDLLVATALHPAMLMYLDNWKSTAKSPNENQGRELLELHTVGRDAGYTEDMVKDSARILSGWTVDEATYTRSYDPSRHATGPVEVLGFAHPNKAGTSKELAVDYLRHLAAHPATARRVCRKIAVRFVSDAPSDRLVEHMAAAYLASGTDIRATLRAMIDDDEFWASTGQKVRTPIDDVVATARVLQVKAKAPRRAGSFAHVLCYSIDSTLVYQWPRPDGPPDRAASWASTTRMLNSWKMHWQLAGGYWPKVDVAYRSPRAFLPQPGMRYDELVDHLSRVLIGRPSTAKLLEAACVGADIAPGEKISRSHPAMRHKFPRVVAALLDTTEHMAR